MNSRRRRRRLSSPTSPATTPPLEDENLLLEILLRLSPLPSSLLRASLVCKCWRRLVSDPRFLRRFRAHHRKPPLLGFFIPFVDGISFKPMLPTPNHIPAWRFYLQKNLDEMWSFFGCRHGLALLINRTWLEAIVWDPITGHQRCVAFPPSFDENHGKLVRNAALLCASAENHDHVHGDCGSHPFKLVLVRDAGTIGEAPGASVCLYASESAVWANVISVATTHGINETSPSVLVGNALHWLLIGGEILQFDFERQSLVVITRPAAVFHCEKYGRFQILRTRENRLGLAVLTEMGMEIWEREGNADSVDIRWVLQQTIKLDKLPQLVPQINTSLLYIMGFDEDSNAIFLSMGLGRALMIQLESMQFRRILLNSYCQCYPYRNFYTPGNIHLYVG
jgi:hypothetical protein